MVTDVIFFIFYFLLFNWLITRISFFKHTQLEKFWLPALFSLKILAGAAYGLFYMQPQYYGTKSDTWVFFELSKNETDWLLHDPIGFLKDIFTNGYQQSSNLFSGVNSYWNDLKETVVVKIMAVCNVFTLKSYFSNIILFNFLFLFGPVALYKTIMQIISPNKIMALLVAFCIPSFLFWCSGLHKDGLIFSCTCLIIYFFHKQMHSRKFSVRQSLYMLVSFLLLFALRNFMAFLLVPALLVWYLCERYSRRKFILTIGVYGAGLMLFFGLQYISSLHFPEYVVQKQTEFKQLPGNSAIAVPELLPNALSFLKFLPTAVDIAFFRPHVSETSNLAYIPAIGEIYLLWILFLVFFFSRKKSNVTASQSAFIIFCLCFSISFLLLAGYTITYSGAIVRYRAVVLPLLFVPLAQWNFKKKYILWGAAEK